MDLDTIAFDPFAPQAMAQGSYAEPRPAVAVWTAVAERLPETAAKPRSQVCQLEMTLSQRVAATLRYIIKGAH